GIEQREGGIEERLLAPDGNQDLRRRDVDAVVLLVPGTNRLAQFGNTRGDGVFGEVGVDRRLACVLHVLGRRKVRLTGAEVHHVVAFAPQPFGFSGDLQGRRRGHVGQSLSKHPYPRTPASCLRRIACSTTGGTRPVTSPPR